MALGTKLRNLLPVSSQRTVMTPDQNHTMFDSEVADEILALKSIFCNPGEFILLSPTSLEDLSKTKEPISCKLKVNCNAERDLNDCLESNQGRNAMTFPIEMTVILPFEYPNCSPHISLSCTKIHRMKLTSLRDKMAEYAKTLQCSGAMIMDLTMWLQHQAQFYLKQPTTAKPSDQDSAVHSVLLLKLDHMRNKSRYVKNIACWTEELSLNGRIFFAAHFIFILLEGEIDKLKEYLRRHKTCNVDVDSSGKPCKERMMNVLVQEQVPYDWRLCGFSKVECKSLSELENSFARMDLTSLYQAHIRPLL